ncbi:MAG: phosphatidylserine decarboxylase [Clostridiaceae bacterium]
MIKIYNRQTKDYEIEKVAGDTYLNWLYSSPIGMSLLESFVKKKLFSKFYGSYCDSPLSKKKVTAFINDFNIDMNISEKQPDDFSSFNDFFYRKLKDFARPIDLDENLLVSHGDGRLLVYENIDLENVIQVKDLTYSLRELIGNDDIADKYINGTCLLLRLCPVDYHRFHFVDYGVCGETKKIDGHYYSVNPVALDKVQRLFCQNKREYSVFHSKNFKDILYVEVGATCVGSILQTYEHNKEVNKGDEKGYFKFGGSTVILFFEKDAIVIDEDILRHSKDGIETKVLMGETIGRKKS